MVGSKKKKGSAGRIVLATIAGVPTLVQIIPSSFISYLVPMAFMLHFWTVLTSAIDWVGNRLETAFYALPFVNSFYMLPFRFLFDVVGGTGIVIILDMVILVAIMYVDPAIPFPGGDPNDK
jgi:hypothetical protein